MLPLFEREFRQAGIRNVSFELEDLDRARDPFVLLILYPSVLQSRENPYVKQQVKLELSGRAQMEPSLQPVLIPIWPACFPNCPGPWNCLQCRPKGLSGKRLFSSMRKT